MSGWRVRRPQADPRSAPKLQPPHPRRREQNFIRQRRRGCLTRLLCQRPERHRSGLKKPRLWRAFRPLSLPPAIPANAWWARQDSNLQPDRYERPALTIELQARLRRWWRKEQPSHTGSQSAGQSAGAPVCCYHWRSGAADDIAGGRSAGARRVMSHAPRGRSLSFGAKRGRARQVASTARGRARQIRAMTISALSKFQPKPWANAAE